MTATTSAGIRLSERVRRLAPSATLAVSARVRELKSQGKDIIGFGAGEPDFDTPMSIREAAIDALRGGMTHYQPVPGTLDARAAIAEKLRRENGIACGPDDVVVTVGGKSAVYLALQALLDEGAGQEVVVPTPAWVSYEPMIEMSGGRCVEVRTTIDDGFVPRVEDLERAITDRTAAIILNSPSNPTGVTWPVDSIRAIGEMLARHPHVVVLSDEIYEKLVFNGPAHLSIASMPEVADRTVTLNGLSKAYAMTGWRLGYVCAPGDGGAMAKAIAKLQGQITSHATSFCYPAIVAALKHADEDIEHMREIFARRAELMHRLLTDIPGVRCIRPTGAFYAFPDVGVAFGRRSPGGRRIESSLDFAQALLDEAHVAVVPGEEFGAGAERCVRLSFACSDAAIEMGISRMTGWMGRLS